MVCHRLVFVGVGVRDRRPEHCRALARRHGHVQVGEASATASLGCRQVHEEGVDARALRREPATVLVVVHLVAARGNIRAGERLDPHDRRRLESAGKQHGSPLVPNSGRRQRHLVKLPRLVAQDLERLKVALVMHAQQVSDSVRDRLRPRRRCARVAFAPALRACPCGAGLDGLATSQRRARSTNAQRGACRGVGRQGRRGKIAAAAQQSSLLSLLIGDGRSRSRRRARTGDSSSPASDRAKWREQPSMKASTSAAERKFCSVTTQGLLSPGLGRETARGSYCGKSRSSRSMVAETPPGPTSAGVSGGRAHRRRFASQPSILSMRDKRPKRSQPYASCATAGQRQMRQAAAHRSGASVPELQCPAALRTSHASSPSLRAKWAHGSSPTCDGWARGCEARSHVATECVSARLHLGQASRLADAVRALGAPCAAVCAAGEHESRVCVALTSGGPARALCLGVAAPCRRVGGSVFPGQARELQSTPRQPRPRQGSAAQRERIQ